MKKNVLAILFFILLATTACEKKERDLAFLHQEMLMAGYTGRYEKPEGALQLAALNLVGIEDFIALRSDNNNIVVIEFKKDNEKKLMERVESILGLFEGYLSEEDKKQLTDSKEKLEKQSWQHNNIVLLWENEEPKELERIIRKNF